MDALKASLRRAIDRNVKSKSSTQGCTSEEVEVHPDILFEKEFRKVNLGLNDDIKNEYSKRQSNDKSPTDKQNSLSIVPPFYVGLPPENDDLRQKLREEARAQFLQRRSKALLDNEELKALYSLLEANSSSNKTFTSDGNAGGSNLSSLETNLPGKIMLRRNSGILVSGLMLTK